MKIGNIETVLKRSSRAVCGPFEKEIIVGKSQVAAIKELLKSKGFFIVGTGPAGKTTTKIWFNPRVSL